MDLSMGKQPSYNCNIELLCKRRMRKPRPNYINVNGFIGQTKTSRTDDEELKAFHENQYPNQ